MSADFDAMWTQGLARGELAFPCCTDCGAWTWYPLPQCSQCQSDRMNWTAVSARGRIFSWTRCHFDFVEGRALAEPAVIALVEIADAPQIRIPCRQLAGATPPVIGEAVSLEPTSLNGRTVWGFRQQHGAAPLPPVQSGAA